SVVVLVTDAAAAAGVVHVTDDQTFVVAVLARFPVHDLSARRRLVFHRGAGRSHVLPFHRAGVLSSNNRVRQAGLPKKRLPKKRALLDPLPDGCRNPVGMWLGV